MSSGFKPDKIEAPASMYSGLSVLSLIVTDGFLKYKHSSGTVPESVITHNAFFSNFQKSMKPNGFTVIIPLGSFFPFSLLKVLG